MDFLPVIILYLEVLLLAFAERKLWNTWFTPLNCLSVPYAVVLAICLCVDGNMGFVPFYYPSVWVWVVGLAAFFVPSCIWGFLQRRKGGNNIVPAEKEYTVLSTPFRILEYITWAIFALFVFRFFHLAFVKDLMPGSELFAREWAGHGFFGHLFTLLMGLNIFWMFAADKDHKRYWLYVLGFFGVALLYLVKGWFLTPMAAGFLLRLLTGKTKFDIKVILVSVFMGFVFFFASYWMTLYVASAEKSVLTQRKAQTEYKAKVSSFIGKHAVTYMAAGVYGLSEDLAQNTLEYREPEKIYAPFVNIGKVVSGDRNYVSHLNDKFVQITTHDSGSNVRTFFGTLYVFSGFWHTLAFVLVFSCLLYGLFSFALKTGNLFSLGISSWFEASMLMGWFDFTANTLSFITVPCFLTAIFALCYVWEHRREIGKRIRGIKWLTVRNIRRLLAFLQVVDLSLLLLFFWTPWRIPSYFFGVSVGIAFAFLLTVPRRAIEFRFLKPYLAFLLLYLLFWVSVPYSSDPAFALRRGLQEISVFLIPFIFLGMTPRFFSPRKIRWFGFCFVIGCLLLFFVKISQLVYCFNYFWPYFKIHYVDAGITYMSTGSGFLYVLNEFLSNQNIYFSWAYIWPIMHTTIEALLFNLAFALVFIALIKKDPWLNTWLKKSLAIVSLILFALVLVISNSKTGQFLFVVNLLLLLVFCFRQKRWITAGVLVSLFLLFGSVGLHYFGMGILGRFAHSVNVMKDIKGHKGVINDGSLLPRLCAWNTAMEMVEEKPFFGFGYSAEKDFCEHFASSYPAYPRRVLNPHNQFLYVLIINGYIGLTVFLLFWVQAVVLVWKNRRLWGWIWLLSLFILCCIDVLIKSIFLLYAVLPYCFLMMEYHNRKIVNSRHIASV